MSGAPAVEGQQFENWDDALAHANKLFNKGEISRAEIDKIARSAFAAKQHASTHNAQSPLVRLMAAGR